MKKLISALILFPVLAFSQYSQYVNPMIGTGGHGHTFPGATLPFGMVQLSPDTRIDGSWDGCSGYHFSDDRIFGFSHTHLSGTGVSDFGDIMLMPTMGEPSLESQEYSSTFSHSNEKVATGFYSVKLDKYDIDVNLTASTRVGFHRYTFNKAGKANVILDLNHRDKLLQGEVRIIDSRTIEVLRRSEAWARNQYVFARIEFSKPMTISKINNNAFVPPKPSDRLFAGTVLALAFSTEVKKGENLKIKVALSPTSFAGAKLNSTEISGWNFEKVKNGARKIWDKQLSKIEISGSDKDKTTIFYTALYHTMTQPNIAQDIDGQYRGRDNQIHQSEGFGYYSVFSLWDTFRAAHPLYTLIEKKRTADFINTFLKQYEHGGRLPVWELASNETDCMIGYHSVSVIADAMMKGIKGFDYEKAFAAAKHSAMLDHLGLEGYKKNGFISIDDEHESVSKTLEYAYDDWCIAQMARFLHKKSDYDYFMKRSQSWKNIFDGQTKFMRPRKNGGWDKPFDAREVNNNFTEGNSWQYSFFVPQDIEGMIAAYGGSTAFEAKLDEMFSAPSQTTGREQVDITGLIGQYAHGNEPSHHMAYLYSYVGKPEKTRQKVNFILNEFYKNAPDGLIGNEDCGQMSAWYVLSAIGLYAVTPGKPEWTTFKPHFDNIKVRFEDGTIAAIGSAMPNPEFGISTVAGNFVKEELPQKIVAVPALDIPSKSFTDTMEIKFVSSGREENYYYKINDGEFKLFDKPFSISKTSNISFFATEGTKASDTISASIFKKPNNYTVAIKSTYNKQYHGGGPEGLIDGIYGDENWRKGDWQGYQGQDFECVIDLKKMTSVNEINANFLQDSRSWIILPVKVEYFGSTDNLSFEKIGDVDNNEISAKDDKISIRGYVGKTREAKKMRYIKVVAHNFGKLPQWHQGFGGDAFIFIDEITID